MAASCQERTQAGGHTPCAPSREAQVLVSSGGQSQALAATRGPHPGALQKVGGSCTGITPRGAASSLLLWDPQQKPSQGIGTRGDQDGRLAGRLSPGCCPEKLLGSQRPLELGTANELRAAGGSGPQARGIQARIAAVRDQALH